MKIYTKKGDSGETSLLTGGAIPKSSTRLHAYGTVDELNAVLGVALSAIHDNSLHARVLRVQGELFVIGADLATPLDAAIAHPLRTDEALILRLEAEIDEWSEVLPPLSTFILPGGGAASANLHHARTVCRRAERWVSSLGMAESINAEALRYLNRLSDWLFVAARYANFSASLSDTPWQRADI